MKQTVITLESARKSHLFQPGNSGKPKGVQNKLTRTVKQVVLEVFNKLQESPTASLEIWAEREPTEFYRIASKLIPTDIKAEVTQVREIQLTTRRGVPQTQDVDHEIITNDQTSIVEPAVIPPGTGGSVQEQEEVQCGGLWEALGENVTSTGFAPGRR